MAEIIGGMASSHAYAFYAPHEWDMRREDSRVRYHAKYGADPPRLPELEAETLDDNAARFRPLQEGFEQLKQLTTTLNPDVLVLIGDDQHENYRDFVPQFCVFTGERFVLASSESKEPLEMRSDAQLARSLVDACVKDGFDVAFSKSYPNDRLLAHAHAQVLGYLRPTVPVVLVFVNAICPPAPEPARCYAFGQALGRAIRAFPASKRVLLYGSGGLSHFSAGYPYDEYGGPLRLGSICKEFDQRFLDAVRSGQSQPFTTLTSRDLLDNGAIEYRQWITLLGALGSQTPDWLQYGAFHRGVMGMGVACWSGPSGDAPLGPE